MEKQLTPFEQAVANIENGTIKPPVITGPNGQRINPIIYQLATHKFYLSLMAKGLNNRQISFTDIKKFYGLKGRTPADILPSFLKIHDSYINKG